MRITSYKEYTNLIRQRARDLRNNPTKAEEILWLYLRRRQLGGYKFLRQNPILFNSVNDNINFFIADFYCHQFKLVIEIDGSVHDKQEQIDYDMMRTGTLQNMGCKVIRFRNEDVISKPKVVVKRIKEYVIKI